MLIAVSFMMHPDQNLVYASPMVKCNLCGKEFSSDTMLEFHTNRKHYWQTANPRSGRAAFSSVAESIDSGESACPKCHGTSFTAKRSVKGKVLFGVLAPKTQVRCVTCGTMYKRK